VAALCAFALVSCGKKVEPPAPKDNVKAKQIEPVAVTGPAPESMKKRAQSQQGDTGATDADKAKKKEERKARKAKKQAERDQKAEEANQDAEKAVQSLPPKPPHETGEQSGELPPSTSQGS